MKSLLAAHSNQRSHCNLEHSARVSLLHLAHPFHWSTKQGGTIFFKYFTAAWIWQLMHVCLEWSPTDYNGIYFCTRWCFQLSAFSLSHFNVLNRIRIHSNYYFFRSHIGSPSPLPALNKYIFSMFKQLHQMQGTCGQPDNIKF